jgi:hypothetical protein
MQTENTTLEFKDGTEVKCLSVYGRNQFIVGANRETLTFRFLNNGEHSVDDLMEIFRDRSKTSAIAIKILYDGQETETINWHNNYNIFIKVEVKTEETNRESDTEETQTIDVIDITMGQSLYSEILEEERIDTLEAVTEVLADIIGGAE